MVISIKNNSSSLVALQQLNATNRELDAIQERVATGLKISSAKDNASSFAVAQKQRADFDAYDAVDQSVNRGINVVDVTISALQTLSNMLIDMKSKAVQASNPALTPENRLLIDTDYQAYVSQFSTIINAATYDNVNLINKNPVVPLTDDLKIISEPTANPANSINIAAVNIKVATVSQFADVSTVANATAESIKLDTMIQVINAALASMGSNSIRLDGHRLFVNKLQDALTLGIGNLVDADLTKESARLKSVQIQQQLGTQALQIANSRPQQILILFQNS